MPRFLSRAAATTGLALWLLSPMAAQGPFPGPRAPRAAASGRRVTAIVRLWTPAADLAAVPSLGVAADPGSTPAQRDRFRAQRDARITATLGRLSHPARAAVAHAIARRGGRLVSSLGALNAVVVDVLVEDLDAIGSLPEVAGVVLDEPRDAHIELAGEALAAPAFWSAGYTGGAVDVAVIDTGLYLQHHAFSARATSVVQGVFHQGAMRMSNYWDIPDDPDDVNGHGTYVAGVIFSQGELGYPSRKGVAHGIDKLYNVKAGYMTYPAGGSSLLSDLMAGVDWALLGSDPPEVFNYSYGASVATDDDPYTQFWDGVVDTFGKTATISAGNSGPNAVGSPGMAYNVLCVASVNQLGTATRADDAIANSSSGGPTPGGRKKPDVAAPGTSLLMPSHYGPALWNRASGTSFAAPTVAGMAALFIDAGVSDPRAVKALLINSADNVAGGGDAWHPRFGWGYVNGERALAQREFVALTSVSGTAGAAPVRFFERSTAAPTKATVAWHRHVSYAIGEWMSASVLRDLDLLLYSRETGELRASSRSLVDNVEQVSGASEEGAVIAIVSGTSFEAGTETVALAHSGGFVARTGPGLELTISASQTVQPASTFLVTATVANAGDMRGHGYTVTLGVPEGYTLLQGTPTRAIGALDAGASVSVAWTIRAPVQRVVGGRFTASASAAAYGLSWLEVREREVRTEDGCGFSVEPSAVALPAAGGSTRVAVTAPAGCEWTIGGIAEWLRVVVDSPAGTGAAGLTATGTLAGSGLGTVTISAPPNEGIRRRTSLDVAGQPVAVTQRSGVTRTYYLAEGSTKSIFTLDIAIANPNDEAVDVVVRFLQPGTAPIERTYLLESRSRVTIPVNDIPGLESTDVSTVVESLSGFPLAVERTMTWDGRSYGGHGGTAVDEPSTAWYFAEGAQGFFDTYLLLANPGSSDAMATVTYLRENAPPVVRTYSVEAQRRTSVYAGDDAALVGQSFSMIVESTEPIIAERAMYWSKPGEFWAGGHESAGVSAPAISWFLAEGATGPYFDEYILIGNPNGRDTGVTVKYLLPTGETVTRSRTIPAQSRWTVAVEGEDERLGDVAVSATVTATDPVVVERAMYWPGTAGEWQEAHNAFGVTETGARWALAEGRVGTAPGFETYILLANPSTEAASVRVTFLREGLAPVEKLLVVPPESRANIVVIPDAAVSDAPGVVDERFGALVEVLNGVGIAVERAMYWNSGRVRWAGGTSGTAVKLP